MKNKAKIDKETKRTITVLVGLCSLLILLVVYISYFQIFKSEDIKMHSNNKRLWINEENVLRGSILDRKGETLSYSEKEGEKNNRYYPYKNLYSHIIGYSYKQYGKAGLEKEYNNELLDLDGNNAFNDIKNLVLPTSEGNDLRLTIDHEIQEKSRELLEGKKGSIITMDPKTGEIYSMVSLPDFDVSNLDNEWKEIIEDDRSPLLNRSIQGLYPPGSIFKIITTVGIIESFGVDENYDCQGKTTIDGKVINDYKGYSHGEIDLEGAFKNSCNPYFADKSLMLEKDKLREVADRFMLNKKIPFDLSTNISKFNYEKALSETEMAISAIGQGDILVTPLNMLMMASAVANDGKMVRPFLVKEVLNTRGTVIKKNKTEMLSKVTSDGVNEEVKDMMRQVVESGTGKNAAIKNVEVSGKTGTAENASGKTHSWFVGFAPFDSPEVSVIVILEEEGNTGGEGAAPIARDIITYSLNKMNFIGGM